VLEPGSVLDKYEIERPVAGGRMGVVYWAKRRCLGTPCAIKVLKSSLALGPKVRTRFGQEAYVQAQLQRPKIVAVRDFIETSSENDFVMDLVDGPSLLGHFRMREPFTR
jgi:eukaryotic-like serine/threonine-protein kinase